MTEYRPKRIVCFNCHSLGHMAKFCPSPSVCTDCGRPHAEGEECDSTIFCVACQKTGHLAVSKVCPSRLPKKDDKDSQNEDIKANGRRPASRQPTSGVSWASAVGGHGKEATQNKSAPSIQSLPDNHPVMIENTQLKKELQELRTELQLLRRELSFIRKSNDRKQSVSPARQQESHRRSRSRTTKKNKASQPRSSEAPPQLITEKMLEQRDAQIKFENSKEWQKAFNGINELQGQFNCLKNDLQQVVGQMREFLQMAGPEDAKRKKKQAR